MHNIDIKQKAGSIGPMTGLNSEVLIDGKPMQGILSVNFSLEAGGIAVLTLKVLGNFKIEGNLDSDRIELQQVLEKQEESL